MRTLASVAIIHAMASASPARIAPSDRGGSSSTEALAAIFARNISRHADANWYSQAHEIIRSDAEVFGIDPDRYAGIVAALSPQQSWNTRNGRFPNLERAHELVTTRSARTFGTAVAKALSILDGSDPLDVLRGPKERSFYLNLSQPGATDAVTVDRWISRAAGHGDRPTAKRYEQIADAIRRGAERVGISPDAFQAAIWVQVRREAGYAT